MECEGCSLTKRTLGFAGNRKIGGAGTRLKEGNIHGVSVIVIDYFAALGLVLGQQWSAAYEARRSHFGGSEGVCVYACACMRVRVCVRVYACACMRARVCVCV